MSFSRSETPLKALLSRDYSFMSHQCHDIIKVRAVLMVHFISNKRESLPSTDQSILSVVIHNGTKAQLMALLLWVKKDVLLPGLTEYVNITKPIYPFVKQRHFGAGIQSVVVFTRMLMFYLLPYKLYQFISYLFPSKTNGSANWYNLHTLVQESSVFHYKQNPNMIYITEPL